MDRTFHERGSWPEIALVVILAGFVIHLFWYRSSINALMALILSGFLIIVIDKMINSTYTFTDDFKLVIRNGKFSKETVIMINEITDARVVNVKVFNHSYVLVTYGMDHEMGVRPDNEKHFLKELKRRQKKLDEELENIKNIEQEVL